MNYKALSAKDTTLHLKKFSVDNPLSLLQFKQAAESIGLEVDFETIDSFSRKFYHTSPIIVCTNSLVPKMIFLKMMIFTQSNSAIHVDEIDDKVFKLIQTSRRNRKTHIEFRQGKLRNFRLRLSFLTLEVGFFKYEEIKVKRL